MDTTLQNRTSSKSTFLVEYKGFSFSFIYAIMEKLLQAYSEARALLGKYFFYIKTSLSNKS